MERLTIADVEPWLLSGKPAVRLQGRDLNGMTVAHYVEWLKQLADSLGIRIATKEIADPPGVVVQSYTGQKAPALEDPLISVTKNTCPWLFCTYTKCRNRVEVPGARCEAHA